MQYSNTCITVESRMHTWDVALLFVPRVYRTRSTFEHASPETGPQLGRTNRAAGARLLLFTWFIGLPLQLASRRCRNLRGEKPRLGCFDWLCASQGVPLGSTARTSKGKYPSIGNFTVSTYSAVCSTMPHVHSRVVLRREICSTAIILPFERVQLCCRASCQPRWTNCNHVYATRYSTMFHTVPPPHPLAMTTRTLEGYHNMFSTAAWSIIGHLNGESWVPKGAT